MRLAGTIPGARVQGLAGTIVNPARAIEKPWNDIQAAPNPTVTGARPPDAMIFSDPEGYLRTVAENADWDGVARWYATQMIERLKTTDRASAFWDLATRNVQASSNRTFNLSDLKAFINKVQIPYIVSDLGTKVGIGQSLRPDKADRTGAYQLYADTAGFTFISTYNAVKNGQRSTFAIGWIREPDKHTANRIIVAIGAAFIGGAAFNALSAGAAAPTSGVASGAASSGASAAASTAAAAIPAGVEVVTTVATALPAAVTAGTVGAGVAAGAIVAASAPPPLQTPPPQTPIAPPIETVVTTATPLPAAAPAVGTVGAGLVAGTVAATATAPAIVEAQPIIEEVITEAPRIEQRPVSPAETAATGLVSVGIEMPTISVREPQLLSSDESTLMDEIKARLQDAVGTYGGDYLQQHLEEWLRDQLGRPPTGQELDEFERYLESGGAWKKALPWLLLAGLLGVALYRER